MIAVVTAEEAFARREPLMVADYTETTSDESYYVARYFGALPSTVDPDVSVEDQRRPQAYYVEQPPKSTVSPHYHDTNQFQIFLEGRAIFGRKQVSALSVHYANAHTPYGPIVTRGEAVHYLTLRNLWDSGGKTMPDCRSTLRRIRRRFRMIEDLAAPDLSGLAAGVCTRQDPLPCEPDGLGVAVFALGAGAPSDLALPVRGAGRYALVLAGTLQAGETRVEPRGCLYLGPDAAPNVKAGPEGAAVIVTQFPPEPD